MNLSVTKKSEYPSFRSGKPSVTLNGKTGYININRQACSDHNLVKGAHVILQKDTDQEPPDWFITLPPTVKESDETFRLNHSNGQLRVTCSRLVRQMLQDFLLTKDPHAKADELDTKIIVRFRLADKPVMDGDKEIPDTFALLGGTILK